jgi:hypothetical protein
MRLSNEDIAQSLSESQIQGGPLLFVKIVKFGGLESIFENDSAFLMQSECPPLSPNPGSA